MDLLSFDAAYVPILLGGIYLQLSALRRKQ